MSTELAKSESVSEQMVNLGVAEKDGKVVVSSRDVARVFGKEHARVMRDIREMSGISAEFRLGNFAESEYLNEQNHKMPEYLMTRDGFTILAMGYTGEKAMQFKVAYIAAFNEMERKLAEQKPQEATTIDKILADPDFGIKLLTELKEERGKNKLLAETVAVKDTQIAEMQPKVNYYHLILQSKEAIPVSVIAKDYGMTGQQMNQILKDNKIQYKQGSIWLPYKEYAEQGYTQTKTHQFNHKNGTPDSNTYTCWTQAGRLFIYDTLKSAGILPNIERNPQESTQLQV